ncbi:zonular occludens toxin domain-containing protein [Cupriavidus necator]
MINLLLGAPGGGKSYEAVAFHVLPALSQGRKVITNLPLVLDQFPPEQRALLEIRTEAKGKKAPRKVGALAGGVIGLDDLDEDDDDGEVFRRPFSTAECYGDRWRHPDSGTGPLYVIDECHMCLPAGKALRKVREWYSMHRHEFVDVLLITQSYGKVHRDIIDLVQVCYRVRKATAFGTNNGYVRKVFDGVRGDVVNTSVRKYNPKFFKFYKSHTKSSQAGAELAANDIVPLWKRWPFIGLAIVLVLLVGLLSSGRDMNPMKPPKHDAGVSKAKAVVGGASAPHTAPPDRRAEAARKDEHGERPGGKGADGGRQAQSAAGPFAGLGIHIMGRVALRGREIYSLVMSQNGQRVFTTTSDELREAGYKVKRISDCAMAFSFGGVDMVAVCDAPQIGVTPGEGAIADKPKREASAGV